MTKKQIAGLLIILVMGTPSIAFAKEAAWWTGHKQLCELPEELTHIDWLAQGSPCELYAIAERKEKEKARRKEISLAKKKARQKVNQLAKDEARKVEMQLEQEKAREKAILLAQEKARKKEVRIEQEKVRAIERQIAQEKAKKKKIQLAQEKARKKEIQLEKERVRAIEKQLAQEKAQKKKIQLAQEKARKKEIQLEQAKVRAIEKKITQQKALNRKIELAKKKVRKKKIQLAQEKARINARKSQQSLDTANGDGGNEGNLSATGLLQPPEVSVAVSTAEPIVVDQPRRTAQQAVEHAPYTGATLSELLARMVKYNRSLEGTGAVAAEVCQGLELCDGSGNMPLKLSVSESADSTFYFGVPVAETAPEIIIMVETAAVTEVYLTDVTGTLIASAINDGGSDSSIKFEAVDERFTAALAWFAQVSRGIELAQ